MDRADRASFDTTFFPHPHYASSSTVSSHSTPSNHTRPTVTRPRTFRRSPTPPSLLPSRTTILQVLRQHRGTRSQRGPSRSRRRGCEMESGCWRPGRRRSPPVRRASSTDASVRAQWLLVPQRQLVQLFRPSCFGNWFKKTVEGVFRRLATPATTARPHTSTREHIPRSVFHPLPTHSASRSTPALCVSRYASSFRSLRGSA